MRLCAGSSGSSGLSHVFTSLSCAFSLPVLHFPDLPAIFGTCLSAVWLTHSVSLIIHTRSHHQIQLNMVVQLLYSLAPHQLQTVPCISDCLPKHPYRTTNTVEHQRTTAGRSRSARALPPQSGTANRLATRRRSIISHRKRGCKCARDPSRPNQGSSLPTIQRNDRIRSAPARKPGRASWETQKKQKRTWAVQK